MVILNLGEQVITGIYGDSNAGRKKYRKWLKEVKKRIGRSEGVIIDDWNANHRLWADRGDTLLQDSRGEELRGWQRAVQWVLMNPGGQTWEREVEGRWRRPTIDLVFHQGMGWVPVIGVKLSANHWTVGGSMYMGAVEGGKKIRQGIDWPR